MVIVSKGVPSMDSMLIKEMKPMKFEDSIAWENVTKAIYNPGGTNGQLFWQKIKYYSPGDE